jgi:hypothetical protein
MAFRDNVPTGDVTSLPESYKGVTCYFCHSIDGANAPFHNSSVTLSSDLAMRAELSDATPNVVHASMHSPYQDVTAPESAAACGACHDIQSTAGAHIERTYTEWTESAFPTPTRGSTCIGCHMHSTPNTEIAYGGRKDRKRYAHDFPAVDVPLTDDADGGSPKDNAAQVQYELNNFALQGALCVSQGSSGITVILDAAGLGHKWPSGASQDRRAWAEVIATKGDQVLFQSGVVPDGTPVTALAQPGPDGGVADPSLWLLRDCMFDAQQKHVDNFWEAATTNGYQLPVLTTFDMANIAFYSNHVSYIYPSPANPTLPARPDKVTLRIRIQPVGLEVLQDLVDSGDLPADTKLLAKMPTFDVSLNGPGGPGLPQPGGLTWTPQSNDVPYNDPYAGMATCAATPGFNPGAMPVPAKSAAICSP